ncbi:MAG TPA: hypothetical protein VGB02_07710 [Pyrinomonadaceae bacterium]
MKFRVAFWLLFVLCFVGTSASQAQVDSLVAQITSSSANTFVRDISGDGRFVVLESSGDISTERDSSRNNADGNSEIFLFDYAQRRIFQITNTRRVLSDNAASATTQANIVVDITNTRPVIANQLVNNELWIAFTSNAAPSFTNPTPAGANPGNFDGTALTDTAARQIFAADANTEIFLYRVLVTTQTIDLSRGIEIPFNNLAAGTFTQVTNSQANSPSQPGTANIAPFISDDNRDLSIDDTAATLAFVSNRNYTNENASPDDNAEVFVYKRNIGGTNGSFQQITRTPRATENAPIFTQNPSISGDGTRLAFYSNASVPRNPTVVPAINIDNADNNGEAFYAVLSSNGQPSAFTQITRTARVNPSDTVVLFSAGRRISRDGRYVGFETLSNNPAAGGGTNQTGYQLYVFDTTVPQQINQTNPAAYRAVGPRSDADAAATFGDVRRFPTFTLVYNPPTNTFEPGVVFASRLNFNAAGTVPATASEGLNPDATRQVQIFSFPLTQTAGFNATFTRISRFPTSALSEIQPYTSNTNRRIAFNIPRELGGGNSDSTSEAFYLLTPNSISETQNNLAVFTGASALPVATPSPSPTPTPTASPTPTPLTAQGLSPDMIAVARLTSGTLTVSQTATGASIARRFPLPIELGGVSLSINNVAAGIYSVDSARGEVRFVTPAGLAPGTYPIVLNDNGRISRGTVIIVAAQPDIFRRDDTAAGGGRASVFNVTTGVAMQGEPFAIRSIRLRGGYNVVQTRLRVFLTGVQGLAAGAFTIKIGTITIPAANILTGATPTDRPGVYSVDFLLPPEVAGQGDAPIVITVVGGGTFTTRPDDTAPRVRILP